MLRKNRLPLTTAAFQHAMDHSHKRSIPRVVRQHLAGAGISVRPFARSQRRFRHHCEVYVPGLHLQIHVRCYYGTVRFPALPLCSVSRPNQGDVNAWNPFSAPSLTLPGNPRSPLLFRSSCENPLDQSVRPVPTREARLTERSIAPCSPAFILRLAPDQRRKLASFRSTYRSVNPGTESIIIKVMTAVKQKRYVSNWFQQLYKPCGSAVYRDSQWIFCA
jgi:hypothetical protein